MAKELLVGIAHDKSQSVEKASGRLISEVCEERFVASVLPRITAQSLVILESNASAGLLKPGDSNYEWLLEDAPMLESVRPALAGFDFRSGGGYEEAYIGWELCLTHSCRSDLEPSSLSEVMNIIRSDAHKCRQVRALSPQERELARRVYAMQRKFDRLHIEAMRKYSRGFDLCILVAGAAHCVRIALKTGWELCSLVDDDVDSLYRTYVGNYVFPKIVLGLGED